MIDPLPSLPIAQGVDAAWLLELITSGGAAGMTLLALLALLSLAALALAIEQLVTLRRATLAPEGLADRVAKRLEAGDLAGARKACREQPSLLAETLDAGVEEAAEVIAARSRLDAWPAVEKAMEDAAQAGSARLLRRIDYLSVIGNLAPMVGLLGTVVGMVFAFREVAATQGAATAGELASGIYQALVTTVGGLLVAIPSLAAFAVLSNRVDALSALAATEAERAIRPLKRKLLSPGSITATAPQREPVA